MGDAAIGARAALAHLTTQIENWQSALEKQREDAALAVREIGARTYAEREAVAMERARVQMLRETGDVTRAAVAAESERAKLLAESTRKVEDLVRSSQDQERLARASNPLELRLLEIEFQRRDFFRDNIPSAAPMAREFDAAGSAAQRLADALTQSAGRITGRPDGRIGRLVPLAEWSGAGAPSAGDPRGMSSFIRSEASRLGIDPDIALRVARSEGLRTFSGDQGTSGGAFQLHRGGLARGGNRVAGLGDDFMRKTGLDPLDPANERATITFALEAAKRMGWSPFHGAARAGISRWEGIGGAPANDNLASMADSSYSRLVDTANYELRIKPQEDFARSIIASENALRARIETLGQDQHAIDEATKRQELMNEAIRQTGDILPEQQAWIDENARAWANLQQRTREAELAERQVAQAMEDVRGTATTALGTFTSDLRQGKSAADALRDSLSRVLDQVIQIAERQLVTSLFGASGQNGGGLFGGLLQSMFGGSSLAGGGGGFFSGLGSLFGFADGGVMTAQGPLPLRRYADGGIARSPQIALFGEAGVPEAFVPMPDPRGVRVVLDNTVPGGSPRAHIALPGGRGIPAIIDGFGAALSDINAGPIAAAERDLMRSASRLPADIGKLSAAGGSGVDEVLRIADAFARAKASDRALDKFAGFFAYGGAIPAGKWGIAGERGPEIVSGPANVIPLNGGAPVMPVMPKMPAQQQQQAPKIVVNNNAPNVEVRPSITKGEVQIMITQALGAYDSSLNQTLLERLEDRRKRIG
jgi:hypothetical protein